MQLGLAALELFGLSSPLPSAETSALPCFRASDCMSIDSCALWPPARRALQVDLLHYWYSPRRPAVNRHSANRFSASQHFANRLPPSHSSLASRLSRWSIVFTSSSCTSTCCASTPCTSTFCTSTFCMSLSMARRPSARHFYRPSSSAWFHPLQNLCQKDLLHANRHRRYDIGGSH